MAKRPSIIVAANVDKALQLEESDPDGYVRVFLAHESKWAPYKKPRAAVEHLENRQWRDQLELELREIGATLEEGEFEPDELYAVRKAPKKRTTQLMGSARGRRRRPISEVEKVRSRK